MIKLFLFSQFPLALSPDNNALLTEPLLTSQAADFTTSKPFPTISGTYLKEPII